MTPEGVNARSAPVPAWSFACLAALLATASLLVGGPEPAGWKLVVLPLCFALPGALIAAGRPDVAVGWLLLAVAVLLGGSAFAGAWTGTPSRVGVEWAAWWTDRFSAFAVPLLLLAVLLLPDGRLPGRGWAPVAAAAVGAQGALVAVYCLAATTAGAPDSELPATVADLPNPVGVLPASVEELAVSMEPVVLGLPLLVPLVAFVVRVRRGAGEERTRLVELLLAAGVFVLLALLGHAFWPSGADLLDVVGAAVLGIGVTTAVLRGRLPGLEVVLHHSVVHAVLTVVVAVGYVAAVGALSTLDVDLPPLGQGLVTAVVALAVLPVRGRLQRALQEVLYGDRADPYAAVRRLDDRLESATSLDEALRGIATSVATALRAPHVAAVVDGERAVHGSLSAHTTELLRTTDCGDGRHLAVTVGWPRGRRLTAEDDALLDGLVRQGGRTVTALLLAAALIESRHALVAAREQERARLRRDLHDELGPTLAGLVMQLAGLRELLEESPEVAAERVPLLEDAARTALEDVRRVSRSLRPPALDELGLTGALLDHASRLGVPTTAEGPPLPVLPPAVEVAAYRIGAEALTNAARHAGARSAVVRLGLAGGSLDLSVRDDGRGWSGDRVGVGVVAMRERAAELGGRLVISGGPGAGTTVQALLPLGGGRG
ncbi:sensor histidine kinase [Nocardioides caldifontis]|uniref:sensor histidine kinase n=1 Tax=Nocardioides caldifontis TaxID=2588938 RepID=UPI0011E042CB|nr:sensor histidine kinase [Nocardioides caldifontis]